MPLYEYRCGGCAERFEVLQRLGATGDDVVCPSCGEGHPQRVLSTFAAGGTRDSASFDGGCGTGSCCADMSGGFSGGGCCGGGDFN